MKIPATVITGFLGAGKTTLIRHLLMHANGTRLALIINEFGELGIDGELLAGCGIEGCTEDDVVELTNGCICCTVADDFLPTIEALLERIEGDERAEPVEEPGTLLTTDLETVADSLYQRRVVDGQTVINFPSRLKFQYVFLLGNAGGGEGGVSMGSRDVLRDLRARWSVHQATNDELLGSRLDAFDALVQETGFSVIIMPPAPRRPIS